MFEILFVLFTMLFIAIIFGVVVAVLFIVAISKGKRKTSNERIYEDQEQIDYLGRNFYVSDSNHTRKKNNNKMDTFEKHRKDGNYKREN
mgnify:CR=1 FL=1|jgi:MFS superfamily sulfate permease-like transporter